MTEIILWEYQVITIGGVFGTKEGMIQETLNTWGEQGWEVFHAFNPSSSGGKVTLMAKRPLTERARRQRSMPG